MRLITGKNGGMSRVVVVHLKKDNLEVWAVENGEKTANAEVGWQPEDLADKLGLIKEKFETESVRVLIASEIAGTETVLNVLSDSALRAKLSIEMVEPESLMEHEGDDVVELANKSSSVNSVSSVGAVDSVDAVGEKKNKKKWWKWAGIGVGAILVVGLIVGGVMRSRSAVDEAETIVITPLASVAPSPSPEPVEMAGLSMQILNGSGVSGRAGEVGELMVRLGVEEDDLVTGNADNYDYEEVEVMMKGDVESRVLGEIGKILEDEYVVISGGELDEESEYDVVVIVGSKN